MNLKEVHRVVSEIKGNLFKKSNHQSIGALKSHFRGMGLQFKEHRIYDHGDDIRFIDWKLLAKTNVPYVKTFEEERNVEIVIILDASPSMFYGYNHKSKLQAGIELTCLLYLLAKETGDYVHVAIVTENINYIPKKRGERGITHLINALSRLGILFDNGKINFDFYEKVKKYTSPKESDLSAYLRQRREVVIFSDFMNFLEKESLQKLIYKKRTHAFRIVSPFDLSTQLPFGIFSFHASTGRSSFEKKPLNLPDAPMKTLKVNESYLDQFVREMA